MLFLVWKYLSVSCCWTKPPLGMYDIVWLPFTEFILLHISVVVYVFLVLGVLACRLSHSLHHVYFNVYFVQLFCKISVFLGTLYFQYFHCSATPADVHRILRFRNSSSSVSTAFNEITKFYAHERKTILQCIKFSLLLFAGTGNSIQMMRSSVFKFFAMIFFTSTLRVCRYPSPSSAVVQYCLCMKTFGQKE